MHYDPNLRIAKRNLPVLHADLLRYHLPDPHFCDVNLVTVTVDSGSVAVPPVPNAPVLPLPSLLVAAAMDDLNITLHC